MPTLVRVQVMKVWKLRDKYSTIINNVN